MWGCSRTHVYPELFRQSDGDSCRVGMQLDLLDVDPHYAAISGILVTGGLKQV